MHRGRVRGGCSWLDRIKKEGTLMAGKDGTRPEERDAGMATSLAHVSGPAVVNSPLSTALFLVILESGCRGVTVCEALRKLLRQGYSKLLDPNGRPRAVQVKVALRKCPDFKEIDSRRFILRHSGQADHRKRSSNGVLCEQSRGRAEPCRLGRASFQKDPCQGGEFNCHLKEGGVEQCRKTDGKHWRCSQQTKPGMLYCERHRRRRSKAASIKDICPEENSGLHQGQNLRPVHTEGDSQAVADALPVKSSEQSEMGDGPRPDRCHRNDGKHWQCSKQVKLGSVYCEHHQGRNKRGLTKGGESGRVLAAREANQPKRVDNHDQKLRSQTVADGLPRKSNEQSQTGDEPKLERCHRNDGKQWQCSKRVKSGSIYCEYHLGRTKRGTPKGDGCGRILAAREENEGEQVPKSYILVDHVKEKVRGCVHAQRTLPRESKHVLQGSEACGVGNSQVSLEGEEFGNERAQIVVVQETRQELHYSEASDVDWPRTAACGSTKKPKGNGHELTKSQDGKGLLILPACTPVARFMNAIHQWKEKPNQNGLTDVKHALQVSVDMSQSAANSLTVETKASQHGQATQERHATQHGKVTEHRHAKQEAQVVAFPLARSSTTLDGCCSVARSVDVQTRDEQQLEQCHRRDGKGWQCSQQCKPGYIYCEHHHGKRSKERGLVCGQQKPVLPDKEVSATCLKQSSMLSDNRLTVNSRDLLNQMEQVQTEKTCIKGRCFKQEEADQQQSKRCHRRDGKGWQCSRQAKHGFNLCEHHQIYVSKRTILKASKKEVQNYGSTFRSWSEMLTIGCGSANEIAKSRPLCMQSVVL